MHRKAYTQVDTFGKMQCSQKIKIMALLSEVASCCVFMGEVLQQNVFFFKNKINTN
jgi:hypothetical protein